MDLALLVYIISLLKSIGTFFFILAAVCGISIVANAIYYSDYCHDGSESAKSTISRMWKSFWFGVIACWVVILIPSEKTAYTMVGAYAAQKVSENDKVQQMSGKVLTIIEQKLDGYIEEGIDEAKKKVESETKRKK
jgi:hypothetical protein